MIKKLASLLFASLLITSCSSSQELEKSLLWEISGNGLEQPSYLFGTIHITCDATLPEKVKTAMDNTSQLVLELDMDDPNMQSNVMSTMMMKDGKTLRDLVSEEDFNKIDSLFIKNLGLSVQMMQTVKPTLLMASFYPKFLDCPIQSFEAELMKVAQAQNEEVKGLETVQDQMNVFDAIPYEDQAKDLVKSARDNFKSDRENIAGLLEVYKTEDIDGMLEMMNNYDTGMIGYHLDKLLDDRNKNWIPKISKISKEQPTFFGVGAGHLPGKNGVINLLRKAGFTVTPVM